MDAVIVSALPPVRPNKATSAPEAPSPRRNLENKYGPVTIRALKFGGGRLSGTKRTR